MELKKKAKEKLKGLIPSKHMAKWKLVAEGSLAVIMVVGVFEIAHYFFHVSFSAQFLVALEIIDYSAVFILAVDLFNHYLISPNKPKFMKNKFVYILSFIPYLIFHKAMGVIYILKPVFTGIAKIIKLVSHSDDIKERIDDVSEKVSGKEKKEK
ncbi:MAG: hypothetical protein ABH986_05240 [archaeon]